jgi:hypothetical protein
VFFFLLPSIFHRSSDDHSPGYDRTFYDRNNSRLSDQETPTNPPSGTATQFIRRPNNYHSTTNDGRGRTRDRHYRNGPYSTIVDRWVVVNNKPDDFF